MAWSCTMGTCWTNTDQVPKAAAWEDLNTWASLGEI